MIGQSTIDTNFEAEGSTCQQFTPSPHRVPLPLQGRIHSWTACYMIWITELITHCLPAPERVFQVGQVQLRVSNRFKVLNYDLINQTQARLTWFQTLIPSGLIVNDTWAMILAVQSVPLPIPFGPFDAAESPGLLVQASGKLSYVMASVCSGWHAIGFGKSNEGLLLPSSPYPPAEP